MFRGSKVSIKDIARAAGVSHSTVSRSLSDSRLVNPDTKSRIQQLARQAGYSPHAGARSLVMGRTRTIGVVVTTIADPFVAEVVQGIESAAYQHDLTVILATSGAQPEREIAAVTMLRSKRVDGIIITSSRVGALYRDDLERVGVPVVLINDHSSQGRQYTFSISVDNRHGGQLATQHLISRGHRRIARYRQALAEAGLPDGAALVWPGDGLAASGQRALAALLERASPPTAVFCYNDMTAVGLLLAARERGLRLPKDLSVVGFDDIPFAAYVYPALTTIAQPKFDMGQRALAMVLALVKAGDTARSTVADVVVQGNLVVRQDSESGSHKAANTRRR
jgi:DNA-binding LacI/PurR family transcriptional regulator